MKTTYLFAIAYFALMSLLLLGSGLWLFIEKIGFDVEDIMIYYAGDSTLGLPAKTLYGQLEVVVPHLGAMGLFIMVMTHFLIFAPKERRTALIPIAIVTFLSAFLNTVSGLAISYGMNIFAYIKLGSFILFSITTIYLLFLLLVETFRTLHHYRAI